MANEPSNGEISPSLIGTSVLVSGEEFVAVPGFSNGEVLKTSCLFPLGQATARCRHGHNYAVESGSDRLQL